MYKSKQRVFVADQRGRDVCVGGLWLYRLNTVVEESLKCREVELR